MKIETWPAGQARIDKHYQHLATNYWFAPIVIKDEPSLEFFEAHIEETIAKRDIGALEFLCSFVVESHKNRRK